MPTPIHVSGPAIIYVGFGPSGSLSQLGISEDGAEIEITEHIGEVKTDAAGPASPADLQDFGEDANIRVSLSAYDVDVMKLVRKRGNAAGEGKQGSGGRLLGANGNYLRLVIDSETDEVWRFLSCVLRGPQGMRSGTKYTVQRMAFYAWALVGGGTTRKDTVLYDHVKA